MTTVQEIWRFPVKSVGGEAITDAAVTTTGIEGDREWGILDLGTGLTLTARRCPELLLASAAFTDGSVVIRLPDGTETADDEVLSGWLGKDVALKRSGPTESGKFEISLAEDEQTDWVEWQGGDGSFHDSGNRRITVVAEASTREWDLRRFRINVITDGATGSEQDLFGQQVHIGPCEIDMKKMVDRCVVVTRPQPGGIDRDLGVLKTINAELDGNLGVGGTISTPGRIAIGDEITVATD